MRQSRKQTNRQGREDWRSTTGKAYLTGRRALRRYVGDIADSALAHAPNRPADFPHYIGITEADARFNQASSLLADADEEIDQYGTREVRDIFEDAMRQAQVLPRLRGQGLYPTELEDSISDEWRTAHDQYRQAYKKLCERVDIERDNFDRNS